MIALRKRGESGKRQQKATPQTPFQLDVSAGWLKVPASTGWPLTISRRQCPQGSALLGAAPDRFTELPMMVIRIKKSHRKWMVQPV